LLGKCVPSLHDLVRARIQIRNNSKGYRKKWKGYWGWKIRGRVGLTSMSISCHSMAPALGASLPLADPSVAEGRPPPRKVKSGRGQTWHQMVLVTHKFFYRLCEGVAQTRYHTTFFPSLAGRKPRVGATSATDRGARPPFPRWGRSMAGFAPLDPPLPATDIFSSRQLFYVVRRHCL